MSVSGTLLSLTMVILMQDKLMGRIMGYYIPNIIIGFSIFAILAIKGKKVKVRYWKYACVICLPLVPHVLSLYLLSSSDTLIITRLCGAEYTAVYSIAYSAYHIVTILFDSMNKAWAPWLLESLHQKKYSQIKKVSKVYIGIFVIIILIYTLIPNAKLHFILVLPGAILATIGWLGLSQGFSIYVRYFTRTLLSYEALGTFIVLLLWLNYTGWVIMLGSVVNAGLEYYFFGEVKTKSSTIRKIFQ